MPGNSKLGLKRIHDAVLDILPIKPSPCMETAEVYRILTDPEGDYQFKVTLRAVQRYLKQLKPELECRPSGIGNSKSYRRLKSAKLVGDEMSVTDALSLKLLEASLRPLMPASILKALEPRLKAAAHLLDAVRVKNPVSNWPNKVASVLPMVPFVPPEIDPEVLSRVQGALIEDDVIECEYRSIASGRFNKRRLHPLGLVQRGEVTYLVAVMEGRSEPIPFALHRMRKVTSTVGTLKRPTGFTLKQFITDQGMGFGAGMLIRLKVRLSPTLKNVISETRLDPDQLIAEEADADGWFRLEANVMQTWQLEWWLLSKIGDLEVLEPEALRKTIVEKLSAASQQYGQRI